MDTSHPCSGYQGAWQVPSLLFMLGRHPLSIGHKLVLRLNLLNEMASGRGCSCDCLWLAPHWQHLFLPCPQPQTHDPVLCSRLLCPSPGMLSAEKWHCLKGEKAKPWDHADLVLPREHDLPARWPWVAFDKVLNCRLPSCPLKRSPGYCSCLAKTIGGAEVDQLCFCMLWTSIILTQVQRGLAHS